MMRIFMKRIICILVCLLPLICVAEVYEQKDQNGNIIFTDMPADGSAKPVDLPQISTAPGPTPKPTVQQPVPSANTPARVAYTVFDLAAPVDQETIQNQPVIPVDIKINPDLQPGDTIQVFIDGSPWGPPAASTHFVFNAPPRGTHTLAAKLIDNRQQTIKETNTITMFIHQAHNGGAP
jgi:hypothetical protein